ncbi:unnamed protein product, partial [Amoebophrya sp. A120]|eukprot:GSA120T00025343001.1
MAEDFPKNSNNPRSPKDILVQLWGQKTGSGIANVLEDFFDAKDVDANADCSTFEYIAEQYSKAAPADRNSRASLGDVLVSVFEDAADARNALTGGGRTNPGVLHVCVKRAQESPNPLAAVRGEDLVFVSQKIKEHLPKLPIYEARTHPLRAGYYQLRAITNNPDDRLKVAPSSNKTVPD